MVISRKVPTDIIPGTKVQFNNTQHLMICFLDIDVWSRSHVKVQGHKRGGVFKSFVDS